jgi:hypothetical protein
LIRPFQHQVPDPGGRTMKDLELILHYPKLPDSLFQTGIQIGTAIRWPKIKVVEP